jgi:ribosomal protein S18 acetylase RimI-like enzyme
MAKPVISLRPSTPSDSEFYYRVLDETMRDHFVFAFGTFDEQHARKDSIDFGRSPNAKVIEVDSVPRGILLVRPDPGHLYVRLLCLLPEAQRIGAGTIAMRQVFAEAAKAKVPVRLRVIASNPVRPFYDRLGFHVVEETPKYWIMEHA